jgi:hypothetical protein
MYSFDFVSFWGDESSLYYQTFFLDSVMYVSLMDIDRPVFMKLVQIWRGLQLDVVKST